MKTLSKRLKLHVSDNTEMHSYIATPEGKGPFPGIIVFQEAFGVDSHIRNVTDRIAGEGFVAIAPELFHRTAPPGFEGSHTDFNALAPHFQSITVDGLSADSKAAYDWLLNQPQTKQDKIGCIGFCMGGRVSFLANATVPLSAAVSYYGGGILPLLDKVSQFHAPHLFFWGGLDKHITHEHVNTIINAMRNAGKTFLNVEFSDADHAFNNDGRPSYNKNASSEAWAMSMEFFKNNLVR